MDDQQKIEKWHHYSSIWRNVLTRVLGWSGQRVDEYIEELRLEMETGANDPAGYGFFFDPPMHYLVHAILGEGLHERIMHHKSVETSPFLIFQRLETAISGNVNHWEMDKESFDWSQARARYQAERQRIESLLTTQEE